MQIINKQLLKNKKCLVICPTRERPYIFEQMLNSFDESTSTDSVLITCLDENDPTLYSYCDMLKGYAHTINKQMTITEIFNSVVKEFPDFKYYSPTNDDFIDQTFEWDQKLMCDGLGYGNDLCDLHNLPTTFVVNGDIVRALGWLQMPKLTHLYNDTVWYELATALKCLNYKPNVLIEHRHFMVNKADKDKTYERTNSDDMYRKDMIQFVLWRTRRFNEDINKIRKEGG